MSTKDLVDNVDFGYDDVVQYRKQVKDMIATKLDLGHLHDLTTKVNYLVNDIRTGL